MQKKERERQLARSGVARRRSECLTELVCLLTLMIYWPITVRRTQVCRISLTRCCRCSCCSRAAGDVLRLPTNEQKTSPTFVDQLSSCSSCCCQGGLATENLCVPLSPKMASPEPTKLVLFKGKLGTKRERNWCRLQSITGAGQERRLTTRWVASHTTLPATSSRLSSSSSRSRIINNHFNAIIIFFFFTGIQQNI